MTFPDLTILFWIAIDAQLEEEESGDEDDEEEDGGDSSLDEEDLNNIDIDEGKPISDFILFSRLFLTETSSYFLCELKVYLCKLRH